MRPENDVEARVVAAFDERLRASEHRVLADLEERWTGRGGTLAGYRMPLRPVFLAESTLEDVSRSANVLLESLAKVPNAVFGGDLEKIARFVGLPRFLEPWMRRFYRSDTRYTFARPDAFIVGGVPSFIEQNISSGIGGHASVDAISEYMDDHPIIAELRRDFEVRKLSVCDGFGDAFLRSGETVGFLDSLDKNTLEPFDLDGLSMVERLTRRGVPIRYLGTAKTFDVSEAGVFVAGARVPLIFRNFLSEELWDRLEELMPLLDACADGRARMIENPYEALFMNKMLLVFLSDPELRDFLAEDESRICDATLPWTRFVKDYSTLRQGERIHVPTLLAAEKDRFVLKKGNGWGGHDVIFGSERDPNAWAAACASAIADGDWIVQERVDVPLVPVPFGVDGRVVFADTLQMACPFIIDGTVSGFLCRSSVPGGSQVLAYRDGTTPVGLTSAFIVADR